MSNSFVTKTDVAEEILIDFQAATPVIGSTWRRYEDRIINGGGWDKGGKLDIPLPQKYIVNDGATITTIPDIEEKKTQLTLDYRKNVPMQFTTQEMTTDSKFKFKERFLTPAVNELAAIAESIVAQEMFDHTYIVQGTAGVCPATYKSVALLRSAMNKMMLRRDKRWLGFSEDCYADIISAGTLQNSFDMKLTKDINRDAQLGRIAQFQSYSSPLFVQHIAGIGDVTATSASGKVSAGTVKTIVTSGSTMTLTGLGTETGVFLKGDKIQFEGVYHVSPIGRKTTNLPFSVVVTDTSVDSSSGDAVINFEPAIVSAATDPFRNISNTAGLQATTVANLITANTGVGSTVKNPYTLNFGYLPEGVIFAAPPLAMPEGIPTAAMGRVIDPETQLSIRLYAFTEGKDDLTAHRIDILFGIKVNGDRCFGLLG